MEIMGSVDSGIHAMCWSPDQDLVVLVTGKIMQHVKLVSQVKYMLKSCHSQVKRRFWK